VWDGLEGASGFWGAAFFGRLWRRYVQGGLNISGRLVVWALDWWGWLQILVAHYQHPVRARWAASASQFLRGLFSSG
ncbi:MAG: hypothetical protein QXM16_05245, partial [Nitrososphaerota archaeon]